jgi:hypothetical protein
VLSLLSIFNLKCVISLVKLFSLVPSITRPVIMVIKQICVWLIVRGYWQPSAKFLKGYWQPSAKFLRGYWQPSAKFLRGYWQPSAKFLRGYWQPSAKFLGGYWQPSAKFLRGYWQPSAKFLRGVLTTLCQIPKRVLATFANDTHMCLSEGCWQHGAVIRGYWTTFKDIYQRIVLFSCQ